MVGSKDDTTLHYYGQLVSRHYSGPNRLRMIIVQSNCARRWRERMAVTLVRISNLAKCMLSDVAAVVRLWMRCQKVQILTNSATKILNGVRVASCLLGTALLSLAAWIHVPAMVDIAAAEDQLDNKSYRVARLELPDAQRSFRPRSGFRVELVVAEPLIRDRVAVDFDARGRMFVVEAPEYNQYGTKPKVQHHGAVKRLDDTDGDGRFDRATVFVEGLSYPTAVACYADKERTGHARAPAE